ncbi:hypothetical protein [Nostoc sp. ChiQUE01b]|uniref:hypothetical protein n=1 Tax=Nostoc sp. ChiQUE01b TaxID=3075376 RepID=UPI002AD2679A|nr:hypothetical protein [Nostoc sp. ChiQUE01b]MDZ8261717.1 hypothetical protein [Nostoc sp. ChiQUE01b]
MNNETNKNISQPDPEWDYYEIWQSLHHIKTKIDAGLIFISGKEHTSRNGGNHTTVADCVQSICKLIRESAAFIQNCAPKLWRSCVHKYPLPKTMELSLTQS